MQKLLMFAAVGMAMFMDYAFGVLTIAGVSTYFGVPLEFWQVAAGALLALLPDVDLIWPILSGNHKAETAHHTSLMHRPIVLLPVATATAWYLGGWFWATVTFICVFYHFLHDTKNFCDSGLEWFWPFSEKEWYFFGSEKPLPKLGVQEWIEDRWLRPSSRSVGEIGAGSLALAVGTGILYGMQVALIVVGVVILGTCMVWVLWYFVRKK